MVFVKYFRTKWKRQTAVGLELLAEAGNFAAFQRLYGGSPYLGSWPYPAAQATHAAVPPPTSIDLYYRQAAAAAAMQKPLPYSLYAGVPNMSHLASLPVAAAAATPFSHLSASSSLSSLSNYYQSATVGGPLTNTAIPPMPALPTLSTTVNGNNGSPSKPLPAPRTPSPQPPILGGTRGDTDSLSPKAAHDTRSSPSPTLNPGSPPGRSVGSPVSQPTSDDEDLIQI